ncbi:MAG: 50S ribosomal protein L1 [Bacteroidota bacterium]|nr:50S ribosomal protein L1 [Bacteroidota bacterium]MDP4231206.1 50S ribosomal protein L1 [Bacteroidota bacterium]MDP4235327.1 50S ribosomal protein L1 [Bacteroidota bacterium]
MAHHGKRYVNLKKKITSDKPLQIGDAVKQVKQLASAKFDESIDIAINLGIDPRKADQAIRGTVALPHGIGKTVHVTVVTKNQETAAREAGADEVGFETIIEKIKGGWTATDVIVATPEVMGELGKLGRVLGPRGLMPNPKAGTVTQDVATAVKEVKAGKIEFRADKQGNVHSTVGKASFDANKLTDNINMFINTIMRAKPASAKGHYLKGVVISSTMGPSVRIDTTEAIKAHA